MFIPEMACSIPYLTGWDEFNFFASAISAVTGLKTRWPVFNMLILPKQKNIKDGADVCTRTHNGHWNVGPMCCFQMRNMSNYTVTMDVRTYIADVENEMTKTALLRSIISGVDH